MYIFEVCRWNIYSLNTHLINCAVFRALKVIKIMASRCIAVTWFSSIVLCDMTFNLLSGWFPSELPGRHDWIGTHPQLLLLSSFCCLFSSSYTLDLIQFTSVPITGRHWNMVSLSPGCPRTGCKAQDGFEFLILCCNTGCFHHTELKYFLCCGVCLSSPPSLDLNCFTLHR